MTPARARPRSTVVAFIAGLLAASLAATAAAQAPPNPSTETAGTATTPTQVLGRPDLRDYYPTASLVNREEGSVRVRICFDDKGRVTGTTVSQSSGFPRLDEAGLRAAQKYRIKPGTSDGVPQAACAVVPMVFMVTGKPIAP